MSAAAARRPRRFRLPLRRARRPATGPRRTPALERWLNHLSTLAVGLSGLIYAWMKYLLEPDPQAFSVLGHPWQPQTLHLHVLAAPVMVLALGMIFREHVLRRLRTPGYQHGRRSGLLITLLALPMIASGYLLQTTTSERGRFVLVVLHLVSGGLFLVGFTVHVIAARRRAAAQAE